MRLDFGRLTQKRDKPPEPSELFVKKEASSGKIDTVEPASTLAEDTSLTEEESSFDTADVTSLFDSLPKHLRTSTVKDNPVDTEKSEEVVKEEEAPEFVIEDDFFSPEEEAEYEDEENGISSWNISEEEKLLEAQVLKTQTSTEETDTFDSFNEPEPLTIVAPTHEIPPVTMAEPQKVLFPKITSFQMEAPSDDYVAAFAQSIESLATDVFNHHLITNLSLYAFGDVSHIYIPQTFEIIPFGKYHRFIGRRFTLLEQHKLYYQIERVFFKDPSREHFTMKLTYPVVYKGVSYITLVASAEDLQSFSAICGYQVQVDYEETDETQLVAVIRKCVQ